MDEKAKEALNNAGNICLFVKENSGDEQTARYMAEAIAAINEAVAQETAKVEQPGNAIVMREALEGIIENLSTRIELRRGNRVTMPVGEATCLVGYARAALSAPPEPQSNATALRDALKYIAWESRNAINSKTTGEERANVLAAYLMDFRDTADAALAEPARNCDRFRTEGEAYAEFGRAGSTFGADTAERLYRYVRWLFASEAHDSAIKTYNGPIRNA